MRSLSSRSSRGSSKVTQGINKWLPPLLLLLLLGDLSRQSEKQSAATLEIDELPRSLWPREARDESKNANEKARECAEELPSHGGRQRRDSIGASELKSNHSSQSSSPYRTQEFSGASCDKSTPPPLPPLLCSGAAPHRQNSFPSQWTRSSRHTRAAARLFIGFLFREQASEREGDKSATTRTCHCSLARSFVSFRQ